MDVGANLCESPIQGQIHREDRILRIIIKRYAVR